MRPGLLDDLGLQAAMEWQAKKFQHRTGIKCEIDFKTDAVNLDQERITTIFRIFQETLTTVARHAEAKRVEVSLKETPDSLRMEVKDNGKGITEEQIANPKSFGLMGMQERAHLLGGNIKISGIHGKKTVVKVEILFAGKKTVSMPPQHS